jgi:hypothetical protein
MPLSKYNPQFGGSARKAYTQMIRKYGRRRGRQIFYATVNKRRGSS